MNSHVMQMAEISENIQLVLGKKWHRKDIMSYDIFNFYLTSFEWMDSWGLHFQGE